MSPHSSVFPVAYLLASAALLANVSPARGQTPLWSITTELRIGGAEDEQNPFTRISSLAVGRDGSMYVADEMQAAVSVYDAGGRLLRRIGRKGNGPGEFMWLGLVGLKGDSIWTYDGQQRRLTLFESNGRVATTISHAEQRPDPRFSRVEPGALLADGSVFGIPNDGGPDSAREPMVRMQRSAESRELLGYLDRRDGPSMVVSGSGVREMRMQRPVSSESLWDVSPSGDAILVVDRPQPTAPGTSQFRVTRLNVRGDTVYSRLYRYAVQPLSRERRDEWTSWAKSNRLFTQYGVSADDVPRAMRIPDYLPPITKVVAGRDGTVWLRREETGADTVSWMVLDANGMTIGALRLPAKLEVHQADRRNVWGVMKDESDVPQILRYRVGSRR
jgi:6-bladed beta-propeller